MITRRTLLGGIVALAADTITRFKKTVKQPNDSTVKNVYRGVVAIGYIDEHGAHIVRFEPSVSASVYLKDEVTVEETLQR